MIKENHIRKDYIIFCEEKLKTLLIIQVYVLLKHLSKSALHLYIHDHVDKETCMFHTHISLGGRLKTV